MPWLNSDEIESAKRNLKPFSPLPKDCVESKMQWPSHQNNFSLFLEEVLVNKFSELSTWNEIGIIVLGSWARGELSVKSDLDLILIGNQEKIKVFINECQQKSWPIRYRIPINKRDWREGVDAFDILSLLNARSITPNSQHLLNEQQELVKKESQLFKRMLSKAMNLERDKRQNRYDSVSNFLEPNLKYGHGGLRDIHQALMVYKLFPQHFSKEPRAVKVLEYYKQYLLNIRQKLQLEGYGEILQASIQIEIAHWLGYSGLKEFMRDVQSALSIVSFYSDWMVARIRQPQKTNYLYDQKKIRTMKSAFEFLKIDSSISAQGVVRELIFNKEDKKISIKKYLGNCFDEKYWEALFRSGLLKKNITELQLVEGLVQHDQYHRYTVYAHLLQTIKFTIRMRSYTQSIKVKNGFLNNEKNKSFNKYPRLSKYLKTLKEKDWQILLWTSFFHDLTKGSVGDHANTGSIFSLKKMKEIGFADDLSQEVSWMVKNHLIYSTAAFRRNPKEASTWEFLKSRKVEGQRLIRLAVFTAIDIQATNIEAWNDWKERLLVELIESMNSEQVEGLLEIKKVCRKKNINYDEKYFSELDPSLVTSLPSRFLVNDFINLHIHKDSKISQEFNVGKPNIFIWSPKTGEYWVRWYLPKDEAGIFLNITQKMFLVGCKVREASIQTFQSGGVYDWFRVLSDKSPRQLKILLERVSTQQSTVPKVFFNTVSLVAFSGGEAILSFRGKDQSGALLSAAQAIFQKGLSIKWARVHTWGRQIDDVFCIFKEKEELLTEEIIKEIIQENSIH